MRDSLLNELGNPRSTGKLRLKNDTLFGAHFLFNTAFPADNGTQWFGPNTRRVDVRVWHTKKHHLPALTATPFTANLTRFAGGLVRLIGRYL